MGGRQLQRTPRYVPLVAVAMWLTPTLCVGQQPSATPRWDGWKLVAQSDLIIRAKLIAPVQEIRAALTSKQYDYLTLHARIVGVVKGTPTPGEVAIRYHTEPASYSPSPQTVIALDQKEVLVFLLCAD